MAFVIESYIQDLIARLEAARDSLPELTAEASNVIGERSVELLIEGCPIDEAENNGVIPGEEGHLADSFLAVEGIGSVDQAQTDVMTEEPIKFGYVTEGTLDVAPIQPTTKKALWWPDAPHPLPQVAGQDPNDFAQQAYDQVMGEVPTLLEETFQPFFDFLRQL
jgi:hypothetical protein